MGVGGLDFDPPKKPENKPKNIFKIFCEKSPKLLFGALFDEKFHKSEYPPIADQGSPN